MNSQHKLLKLFVNKVKLLSFIRQLFSNITSCENILEVHPLLLEEDPVI